MSLKNVRLNLACNDVADAGAQALAGLQDGASIENITLDMSRNKLGKVGGTALAAMGDCKPNVLVAVVGLPKCIRK